VPVRGMSSSPMKSMVLGTLYPAILVLHQRLISSLSVSVGSISSWRITTAWIDSPHFGVQYDPSNAIVAGDDPLELLEDLKSRVKTVHASDRFLKEGTTIEDLRQADGTIGYSPNLSHGVTGKGLNDYDAILSILREADFNGWVSIEDGMNGVGEMKESMDFLRMMRDKYL